MISSHPCHDCPSEQDYICSARDKCARYLRYRTIVNCFQKILDNVKDREEFVSFCSDYLLACGYTVHIGPLHGECCGEIKVEKVEANENQYTDTD